MINGSRIDQVFGFGHFLQYIERRRNMDRAEPPRKHRLRSPDQSIAQFGDCCWAQGRVVNGDASAT